MMEQGAPFRNTKMARRECILAFLRVMELAEALDLVPLEEKIEGLWEYHVEPYWLAYSW